MPFTWASQLKTHILLDDEFVYCQRLDPTFVTGDEEDLEAELVRLGHAGQLCKSCLREFIYSNEKFYYFGEGSH